MDRAQQLQFTASTNHDLITELQQKCDDVQKRITHMDKEHSPYIQNRDPLSEKVHASLIMSNKHDVKERRTKCGWKFGLNAYTPLSTLPGEGKMLFEVCLKSERKALVPFSVLEQHNDSDSSSSDSSSDS